jgi:diadenosine tetraphosphate (Ap4A) HIT family hydrolase
MDEIARLSAMIRSLPGVKKLNVGSLGNMVPQLHVHVIARFRGDPAWPKPVWNAVPARDYDEAGRQKLMEPLRARLTLTPV